MVFAMFHAEANKKGRVLTMSFAQHVDAGEMKCCFERVKTLLDNMEPGFRLVTDLSSLNDMDVDCAPGLGAMMDLCDQKGVKAVISVVPDPRKDIGFTLMSHFHYRHAVNLTTYKSLADPISGISK